MITDSISFADMLYIPLKLRLKPYQVDLVCVDEAQDMNKAQLRLAARARRSGGRMVVVGDDRQAIYAFRGAAPGALDTVADALRARRLSLTVSFRCAHAIIAEARRIVPDIEAAPNAESGLVTTRNRPDIAAGAGPGDFVLSRTNAALVGVCLRLLRAGKRARIVGRDIADALVRLLNKLRGGTSSLPILIENVLLWQTRELAKARALDSDQRAADVDDMATTLIDLAMDADTMDDLMHLIRTLFVDVTEADQIVCSTVHRAKGLEADRVWLLSDTFDAVHPTTDIERVQEANLRYVAITRARRELVWVNP